MRNEQLVFKPHSLQESAGEVYTPDLSLGATTVPPACQLQLSPHQSFVTVIVVVISVRIRTPCLLKPHQADVLSFQDKSVIQVVRAWHL